MTARLDGESRSDKGVPRKYSSITEKEEARRKQRLEASRRYRERNRDLVRLRSLEYRTRNKEACIRRTQQWQEENPRRAKDAVYRRKYGVSLFEYEEMVRRRGGRCDICGCEAKLVIDHCHDSQRVRGLLCDRCNVGLGCLGDNRDQLMAAVAYITRYARLVEWRLSARD